MLANPPGTIRGNISSIRFWHLLVGMPDFPLGGWRYVHVLLGLSRNSRANRKMHATLEMMNRTPADQNGENTNSVGVGCADVIGFSCLLRAGGLKGLGGWTCRYPPILGETGFYASPPTRSKTDKYSEFHTKTLKGTDRPLCPVRGYARRLNIDKTTVADEEPVFGRGVRKQLPQSLKLAAVTSWLDSRKISNHSSMSGGASIMSESGFAMEIIKRRGRWIPTTFHQYLRSDEHVMSGISRGCCLTAETMAAQAAKERGMAQSQSATRINDWWEFPSACQPLRHHSLPGMAKDGRVSTVTALGLDGIVIRQDTFADIQEIAGGCGGKPQGEIRA